MVTIDLTTMLVAIVHISWYGFWATVIELVAWYVATPIFKIQNQTELTWMQVLIGGVYIAFVLWRNVVRYSLASFTIVTMLLNAALRRVTMMRVNDRLSSWMWALARMDYGAELNSQIYNAEQQHKAETKSLREQLKEANKKIGQLNRRLSNITALTEVQARYNLTIDDLTDYVNIRTGKSNNRGNSRNDSRNDSRRDGNNGNRNGHGNNSGNRNGQYYREDENDNVEQFEYADESRR